MKTCEECGTRLNSKWLEKTGGEELCKECFDKPAICDDCGARLKLKNSVTVKGHTQCRECMLKDELPIEVMLVRSNWAPWGDEPTISKGDLELPFRESYSRRSLPVKHVVGAAPVEPAALGGVK